MKNIKKYQYFIVLICLVLIASVFHFFYKDWTVELGECPGYKNQTAEFGNTPTKYTLERCYKAVAIEHVESQVGNSYYRVWDFTHQPLYTFWPLQPIVSDSLSSLRYFDGKIYGVDNGFAWQNTTNSSYSVVFFMNATTTEFVYKNKKDIPRYRVVDTQTGEVSLYKTLEEAPTNERMIFEELQK